ncbi:MAG: Septum formation initiator [Firmicutes bacterium]|nr:Septum formation initiator [Bacillota bacterium]
MLANSKTQRRSSSGMVVRNVNQQRKFRWNWCRLLVVLLTVFFLYVGISQQLELRAVQREAACAREELAAVKQMNQQLQQERSQLSTPEYVEKLAREELGLVKPGEIPYIPAGKE